MPHVTFIHGIGNKPPAARLGRSWRGVLAENGLDLDASGVTSTFVYWADLLHPAPLEEAEHENARSSLEGQAPEIGMRWLVRSTGAEAAFIAALADRVGLDEFASDDPALPAVGEPDPTRERVLLPWSVKRRLMKVFLRDVHHYLFDAEFSPREGESYAIRREIRSRVLRALAEGADRSGPHVVVAHSLGSVIAYDCLKRLPGCPPVDGLLTFGSPLGIDEVQDRLRPEWSRDDGFPAGLRRWVNVYDRLDPVAGVDALLANDFRRGGVKALVDVGAPNRGAWRHGADKYLAGAGLRDALAGMLDEEW
ncbi:hypothetical protein [Saccharothrix sp. Mg75]|uniref:hypothetical protein n=1 Tax=Saccharothrix sp. Mg75 TaxID=3445357 RepID=UPI003EEB11A3